MAKNLRFITIIVLLVSFIGLLGWKISADYGDNRYEQGIGQGMTLSVACDRAALHDPLDEYRGTQPLAHKLLVPDLLTCGALKAMRQEKGLETVLKKAAPMETLAPDAK